MGCCFVVLGLFIEQCLTQLCATLVDCLHLMATLHHELRFCLPHALWLTW